MINYIHASTCSSFIQQHSLAIVGKKDYFYYEKYFLHNTSRSAILYRSTTQSTALQYVIIVLCNQYRHSLTFHKKEIEVVRH